MRESKYQEMNILELREELVKLYDSKVSPGNREEHHREVEACFAVLDEKEINLLVSLS